jgi:hypothetical protein
MATRRSFLAGAAALGAGAALGSLAHAASDDLGLVSAARAGAQPCGVIWREGGMRRFDLPGRGHAIARVDDGAALIVGRRPGEFAAIADLAEGRVRTLMQPSAGARFSGHGAVSPDGRLMVTSEFDAASIEGRLTVRSPGDGVQRAVWPAGGVEPHDIGFAAHGARLVAALGGLVHDGGVAGPALNPGGVRSAVVEIDPSSGRILTRHALGKGLESLSLRHLAFSPDGRRVGVGMQDQDLSARRSLMGVIEVGGGIDLLPMPDPIEIDFRGYVGSVAMDTSGDYLAASSPRGGVAGLWSMRSGRWLGGVHVQDACGLAAGPAAGEFWLSSGYGDVLKLAASPAGLAITERRHADVGFDNHLLRI